MVLNKYLQESTTTKYDLVVVKNMSENKLIPNRNWCFQVYNNNLSPLEFSSFWRRKVVTKQSFKVQNNFKQDILLFPVVSLKSHLEEKERSLERGLGVGRGFMSEVGSENEEGERSHSEECHSCQLLEGENNKTLRDSKELLDFEKMNKTSHLKSLCALQSREDFYHTVKFWQLQQKRPRNCIYKALLKK